MRKALTLLIALLSANLALAQNKPLACQADATAGLRWENGQWKTTRFIERKFILIMSGNTLTKESVNKALYPELNHLRILESSGSCNTNGNNVIITCVVAERILIFNPQNNRGGISWLDGALDSDNANRDTVSVGAFTCQSY